MEEHGQHSLLAYLKGRWMTLTLFALFFAVYLAVYLLYHAPLEPALYAALLCGVLAGLFLAGDYVRERRARRQLHACLAARFVTAERLPEAADALEEDYRQVVELLLEQKAELQSERDRQIGDMLDYYTLWAHQIKTPIAALQLLLQTPDPSSGELRQELFQIDQYVDMVLCYLRLASLSSDLVLQEYSLADCIRRTVKKFAVVFLHKKISLHWEETDVRVLTDEKWLRFVLEQLLSNALKYTPPGGVITITADPADNTLTLEDTGVGIRPEDMPRIFERGFTGGNGRLEQKSTGLGLYLCRQILGKLGHPLSIESEPGRGTRVILRLGREKLEVE